MRYFLCPSPIAPQLNYCPKKASKKMGEAITNNGLMNIIIRCPTNDPF